VPAVLDLAPNETGQVQIVLTEPAPVGGWVLDVASSVPGVATVPTTVTVPAGALEVELSVQAQSEGSTTLTVSHANLGTATASVRVKDRPTLMLTPKTGTLGITQTLALTVSLPTAAPAEGVVITLLSSDTSKVRVPTSVLIAESEHSVVVEATGVAEGESLITASATGYNAASSTLTVRPLSLVLPENLLVQPGNTRPLPITLTDPAPEGGLTISLVSSDESVVTVPASLEVAAGATTASTTISGVAAGSAHITASAPAYQNASTAVQVDLITIDLQPSGAISIPQGLSQSFQVRLSKPAPTGGATIDLTMADTTIAGIEPTPVLIPAGQTASSGTVTVSGMLKGTTTLTLGSPGMTSKTINVTVSDAATLRFESSYGSSAVGRGMRSDVSDFYVGRRLNNQWLNGAEAVTVTLTSADPGKLTVPATVTIPAGQSLVRFQVEGVGLSADPVAITASATDYTPETPLALKVVTPSLTLNALDGVRSSASERDDFTVSISVSGGSDNTQVADLWVDVGLTALDPAGIVSGFFDAATGGNAVTRARIAAGDSQSGKVYVERPTTEPGHYQVTATAPDLSSITSSLQQVTSAQLRIDRTEALIITKGFTATITAYDQNTKVCRELDHTDVVLTVSLTSAEPTQVGVPATVEIPEGWDCARFGVSGLEITDTPVAVTASAPGYPASAPLWVTVVMPQITFDGLDDDRSVESGRDGFTIRLALPANNSDIEGSKTGWRNRYDVTIAPITVDLAIVEPEPNSIIEGFYEAAMGNNLIAQVTIPEGVSTDYSYFDSANLVSTPMVYVGQPTAAGSYSVATNVPGIGTALSTVQAVDMPRLLFSQASRVVGQGVREDFVGIRVVPEPSTELTVTLSVSETGKIEVPATITIPAGISDTSLSIIGRELTSNPVLLTAQAPGYAPGRASVRVVQPQLRIEGPTSYQNLARGRYDFRIGWMVPGSDSVYHALVEAGMANLRLEEPSPPGIVSGFFDAETGGNPLTQVTLPEYSYGMSDPVFVAQPTALGTYKITVSAPGFTPATSATITVQP